MEETKAVSTHRVLFPLGSVAVADGLVAEDGDKSWGRRGSVARAAITGEYGAIWTLVMVFKTRRMPGFRGLGPGY